MKNFFTGLFDKIEYAVSWIVILLVSVLLVLEAILNRYWRADEKKVREELRLWLLGKGVTFETYPKESLFSGSQNKITIGLPYRASPLSEAEQSLRFNHPTISGLSASIFLVGASDCVDWGADGGPGQLQIQITTPEIYYREIGELDGSKSFRAENRTYVAFLHGGITSWLTERRFEIGQTEMPVSDNFEFYMSTANAKVFLERFYFQFDPAMVLTDPPKNGGGSPNQEGSEVSGHISV